MKNYFIYLFLTLFSLFLFTSDVYAKTEAVVCDYNGYDFNARLRIFTDNSVDLNVEDLDKSSGNLDDDTTLYNWDTSTYKNNVTGVSVDTGYAGIDTFTQTGRCPEIMVYVHLTNSCNARCARMFVANDSGTLTSVRAAISQITTWQNNGPVIYTQTLSYSYSTSSSSSDNTVQDSESGKLLTTDCSIIPDSIQELLNKVLNIMRFVAPVLLLVFSSVDFLKAVTAGSKDDLKTAGTKLLKRCIICVVLFFIPTILNLLLEIIGNANGTCGVE